MKAVRTLLIHPCIAFLSAAVLFPVVSHSQCSGTLKSISYNAVVSGTGNNLHVIDIPQFDPSKGTLVAVKITSVITLQYAFQLENNNNTASSYLVGIGRNDHIASSALSSPLNNMGNILLNYGPYLLAASNGIAGSGPDFISVPQFNVLNNYSDISDSVISDISNFLGTENIEFDYSATTYYKASGNYSFGFTASDTINFTVSYYYCSIPVITSSLVDFDAKLQKDNAINISWQTANDQINRTYNIERSSDGASFDEVTNVKSIADTVADYFYDYNLNPTDKNKVYFRLKIVDQNNNTSYSTIREVDLAEQQNTISLYPNPSHSFINVLFNRTLNNFQIDVLSSTGQSIQKFHCSNTSSAHIDFINSLPPGVYFIHAYDFDMKKNYVLSFMTQ
ncbi:MAG TPA: choice-of-anchor E domain-containing protein [Puia sp.]|nr:choice-of-anchor E domain-containing protein [Puia sp.]